MNLIGVAGRSGSGKTRTANALAGAIVDSGDTVKLDAFSLEIKRPVRKQKGREYIDRDADRGDMQRYGTMMRKYSPFFFVNLLFVRNNMDADMWEHFSDKWKPADFLVIGDVRFSEEVRFIRAQGGVIFFVEGCRRPLRGAEAEHESESHFGELRAMADILVPEGMDEEELNRYAADTIRARRHIRVHE